MSFTWFLLFLFTFFVLVWEHLRKQYFLFISTNTITGTEYIIKSLVRASFQLQNTSFPHSQHHWLCIFAWNNKIFHAALVNIYTSRGRSPFPSCNDDVIVSIVYTTSTQIHLVRYIISWTKLLPILKRITQCLTRLTSMVLQALMKWVQFFLHGIIQLHSSVLMLDVISPDRIMCYW